MNKKSIWPVLRLIIFCIQLFFQSLCTTLILILDVLPGKHIALFFVVMVLLAIGTGLLVFVKVYGGIALWRKIVACILALVIALACGVLFKLAMDAQKLIQEFTGDISDTRNTYVVVLNDDVSQSLKDTKGYRYGLLEDYDVDHTQQMLDVIQKEIGESPIVIEYQQITPMVEALYLGDVDALIMNGVSLSLLIEQPDYENFLSHVHLLYTLPYQKDQPETDDKKEPEKEPVRESAADPFVVYISGSDTRSALLQGGLSDVNILVVVNPNTRQILLVNTPRDYYVPNPAGKGALDKLTHCANYGVDCSMEVLSTLYDTNVDYYGRINFVGFKKLIDAVGGITVVTDYGFTAISGDYFPKGENILNGEKALVFARERHRIKDGDSERGKNQMKVITAVINKLSSSQTLIANYSGILKSLEGLFATNFTPDEISDLVKMQMDDMSTWNVQSYGVTGTSGYEETYSWKGQKLSILWPKEDAVNHAKTLIARVLNGEILTAEDTVTHK